MSGGVEITSSNFESEVLNSSVPVLVDFWAEWCNPCKMIAPMLERLADEYGTKLKVAKLNVDQHPDIAGRFGISGIPALLFSREGNLVHRVIGYQPQEALKIAIRNYLKLL